MATLGGKQQIVTFKAEDALVKAMEDIPNRSEFIRSAILAALVVTCLGLGALPAVAAPGPINPPVLRTVGVTPIWNA